jgi:hypothetical protein
VKYFPGTKLKDQFMKKICLTLALAGVFVLSVARATTIAENFTTNPLQNGWQIFGDTNLFQWDSTNQNLGVTWDSSRTNSYFYHPLGTILTREDDFSIEFYLRMNDIGSGTEPGKTGPMELAVGFMNLAGATSTNFMRGVYYPISAPTGAVNLVEFDYFPSGYYDFGGIFPVNATTQPVFISTNGTFAPTVLAQYVFELPTNQTVHVSMAYTATNQTMVTVLTNEAWFIQLPNVVLTDGGNSLFTEADNFHLDTISISSYSSVGDDYDSVLAHGVVDNVVVTVPPPPVQNFTGSFTNVVWQGQFLSRSNWLYAIERTTDFASWTNASPTTLGNATNLFLQDTNPPVDKAFYRVRAERP